MVFRLEVDRSPFATMSRLVIGFLIAEVVKNEVGKYDGDERQETFVIDLHSLIMSD